MMTTLSEQAIHEANLTSFGSPRGDAVERDVNELIQAMSEAGLEDKDELASRLIEKANAYLYAEGSHVSRAVAGGSKYKENPRGEARIDRTAREYFEAVDSIKKSIQRKERQREIIEKYGSIEAYERKKQVRDLTREIGYFAKINKPLCLKALVELHGVDKEAFKSAYETIKREVGIGASSKATKLYREMMAI